MPLFPIGLSALLALAAPASSAGGESVPIRVEFDAPTGCSSVDAFYAGLLTRMSRARRAVAGEEAVHLSVRLTRLGTKVRGDLRLMDGPGDGDTRRVEGESCESVVEVLSLTAALALTAQPTRVTPPPPPRNPPPSRSSSGAAGVSSSASSSSQSAEATPKPPEAKPPEAPPPPPPEADKTPVIAKPPPPPVAAVRRTGVHLGLQAVAADVITTDSFSFGGGVAARLERHINDGPGASIALAFIYVPNDLLQTPEQIAVRWTALAVTGCPPWGLGRTFTLQACAQGIGGWLSATGRGITNPSSVGRTWWSVGALLRAGAKLGGGFALELEAGATVPLVERRFVTTTPDRAVGQTPTIAPIVVLGLSRSL